jgi:hypothetical protein
MAAARILKQFLYLLIILIANLKGNGQIDTDHFIVIKFNSVTRAVMARGRPTFCKGGKYYLSCGEYAVFYQQDRKEKNFQLSKAVCFKVQL